MYFAASFTRLKLGGGGGGGRGGGGKTIFSWGAKCPPCILRCHDL